MNNKLRFLPSAQLYLSLAFIFATWVVYIPTIIDKLDISKGQLGFALSFSSIGSLIATFIGKNIVQKYGEGRMAFFSTLVMVIFGVNFFIAPHFYYLVAALFGFGVSTGILQIAVNSLVTIVEKKHSISIMSTCHGFFSLGGLIAAGFGTLLLVAIGNPLVHILLMATIVVVLQFVFKKHYYTIKNNQEKVSSSKQNNILKKGLIWVLATICLVAMVSEGAIADWSGLYLKDVAKTNEALLGLGYAGFSLSMTIGRLVGDFFSKKYGAWQILFFAFLISLVGFILVLTGYPVISIMGFVTIGAGFSIIVPEVYRLSANVEGVNPSSGIAFMSGAANVGFLGGPVVLGIIAEGYGLHNSFIVLLGLVGVGALLASIMQIKAKIRPATT